MIETEVHLTPDELAQRLKMKPFQSTKNPGGRGTLANWRVAGRGPKFLKFGKIILYPLKEVEAWETQNLKRSTVDNNSQSC